MTESALNQLEKYGLQANTPKCEFFKERIQFCGDEIDNSGLHKTKEKIDKVFGAPQPQNVSQLRSFMGLINYYHQFLHILASVLQPLSQLLEKNRKWRWTRQFEESFREVKQLITSELVLTHYNPKLPVKLAFKASTYGFRAVISHVLSDGSETPSPFVSRTLNSADKNNSHIDKEALAVAWESRNSTHFYCI